MFTNLRRFGEVTPMYARGRHRLYAWLIGVLGLALCSGATPADAKIFYSKKGALAAAFPGADQVVARDFLLKTQDVQAIEKKFGGRLSTRLVTIYEGRRKGRVQAYAIIDSHRVRTLPETLMAVVTPEGTIKSVYVLAFHEPLEYLPPPGWLARFQGQVVDDHKQGPRKKLTRVAGVAGATMSSRAVNLSLRRVSAYYQVLLPQPTERVAAKVKRGDMASGTL